MSAIAAIADSTSEEESSWIKPKKNKESKELPNWVSRRLEAEEKNIERRKRGPLIINYGKDSTFHVYKQN